MQGGDKGRNGAAATTGVYNARAGCEGPPMIEILRANDPVLLSFVEAILKEAGIDHLIADRNMSVLEGSIGILARRVLVADDDAEQARALLRDAGLGNELRDG